MERTCRDGLFDVKEIKSSARKRRISGLFRRFGFEARLLKKLGFLIWKHIHLALYFIVKWAVKNGIKEAYRDITGKVTTEDIVAEQICNELGLNEEEK